MYSSSILIIFLSLPIQTLYQKFLEKFSYYNISPDNNAYIIYTSGSTGNPKGTMVTHKNISTLKESIENDFVLKATNKDISDLTAMMQSEQTGATESMLATIKRISKENDDLINTMDKLSQAKLKSMREKAFSSKQYKSELDDYVSTETLESHWWNPKFGNKYQKMLGHNSRYGAMWRGLKSVSVAPAGTWVKADAGVLYPMYWEDGITLTPEMVETQLQELEAQKEQLKAALKELEN